MVEENNPIINIVINNINVCKVHPRRGPFQKAGETKPANLTWSGQVVSHAASFPNSFTLYHANLSAVIRSVLIQIVLGIYFLKNEFF